MAWKYFQYRVPVFGEKRGGVWFRCECGPVRGDIFDRWI